MAAFNQLCSVVQMFMPMGMHDTYSDIGFCAIPLQSVGEDITRDFMARFFIPQQWNQSFSLSETKIEIYHRREVGGITHLFYVGKQWSVNAFRKKCKEKIFLASVDRTLTWHVGESQAPSSVPRTGTQEGQEFKVILGYLEFEASLDYERSCPIKN